jgi:hypothetical protein
MKMIYHYTRAIDFKYFCFAKPYPVNIFFKGYFHTCPTTEQLLCIADNGI